MGSLHVRLAVFGSRLMIACIKGPRTSRLLLILPYTVEFQWLEHFWNHENMFETEVVRANEC